MAAAQPTAIACPVAKLNNGATMPVIGFGTWRCDAEKLEAAVYHALQLGYRHIDCAPIYKNEPIVGKAIQRAIDDKLTVRSELFIASKLP